MMASIERWIESILDMLDRLITRLASNSNDIEAYWPRNTVIAHIGMGSLHQSTYLIVGDSIYRVAKAVIPTSLHLHNDKHAILLRHNINFLMSETPITIAYGIPAGHEISHCTVFANPPELIVLCHNPQIWI